VLYRRDDNLVSRFIEALEENSQKELAAELGMCLKCFATCLLIMTFDVLTYNMNRAASARGATTSSKFGVQFLSLGYYYPSTEQKLDRSTQSGAVGYIITLYSSKSYVKTWGPFKFWGVWTHPTPHSPLLGLTAGRGKERVL